jgi:hypothetical protein
MSYIFEDGVEGSIWKFGYDSMNEKEVKRILWKVIMRLVVKKILNKIKRIITKGMHVGMMMQCMAMVWGTNSNIAGRC